MGSNSCLLLCMLLLLVLEKNSSFVRFQFIKSPITIATIKKINVYSSVEGSETSIHDDNEMDINLIEETVLDQSIEKAVRQMLDDGPKQIELSPTEKFKLLYESMKKKDGKESKGPHDPAQLLASLFTEKPTREPFDDRKVMIKLRQVLNPEDFAGLFKDPMIGDIY